MPSREELDRHAVHFSVGLIQIKGGIGLAVPEEILRASADLFADQCRDTVNAAGDGPERVTDARLLIIEKGAPNPLCCQRVVGWKRIVPTNPDATHRPIEPPEGFLRPRDRKTPHSAIQFTKTLLEIGRFDGKKAEHGVAAIRAPGAAPHQCAITGAHVFKGLVRLTDQELISSEQIADKRHECDPPPHCRPTAAIKSLFE